MNRRLILGVLLIGTLVAAWFAPPVEGDGVQVVQRAGKTAGVAAVPASVQSSGAGRSFAGETDVLSIHERRAGGADEGENLFVSMRWEPEEDVPEAGEALEEQADFPPQAPPLPFRVLGRYDESGTAVVFLEHQEQSLLARVGETLINDYRVESIEGASLVLRYLPLDQLQTLEIGGF